ncbi:MAG: class I SAM-dependent methyltransferase [Propioniciclava sp.]|uniref:class I SAM-dependent methyltransferase n=1 Tax=Propioniciclava sp. TaxID=2038686 RepID=UPI0039E2DED2
MKPGTTPTPDTWFVDNEANWDDRADLHMGGGYSGIDGLIADKSAISNELAQDLARFGDLSGKDVIHLQCHLGTDTIGFARRGANRVVGVDLSANSLRDARNIADAAGLSVEYVHANVYDARAAVEGDFDLVYTSLGVLCWLPDIDRWARTVASLLKPGGAFFIRDDHPMFMTIWDIGDDAPDDLLVKQSYFQQVHPLTWEDEGSYADAPGAPRIKRTTNHQWNHSLAEIITALIRAGLVIDVVEETPFSAWCAWPHLMVQEADGRWRLRDNPERLPLQFVIEAHKN